MSQRVKKPGRSEESQGKRRRRRPSGSDADEDGTRSGSNSGGNGSLSGMWTPRHLNDLKVSSIYNRNSAEAPAELYRKDLISAMKLADSEPLTPEEYFLITDPWKQEWEKGVQVPVNPESLPESEVAVIKPVAERSHDFRLPKKKYVRVTHDDFFNPDFHQLVSTAARAEKVCSYDLDDVDAAWLAACNGDRVMQALPVISEFLMEQVIEELEVQCWEQVQTILKSQEGLGIEYDENVICDVCRSPESEEGNEMVFCDACNICVHQACYGITAIPSGSWLCRTCNLGIRPACILCPNTGGAMKATRSGHKWAHVACAIWIPEVSIGSVEKMEPITKISSIPSSRWNLRCVLCKECIGACIQCSVKTCKTAYHVTCAFKKGLEMKPIIVDENADDGIKLRSYCEKHSVNTRKTAHLCIEEDGEKRKTRAILLDERIQTHPEKLQQIEAEFYKYVRLKDVSQNLAVEMDIVSLIYSYWKLKRKACNNRPLVPPRPETSQLLTQQQEQDLEQMKMFVQLRQDLERVRNLCYMVSRREKLSRTFFKLREQTFQKQVALLNDKTLDLATIPPLEKAAILDANHGPSIYDKCYSHGGVSTTHKDYDALVSLILGEDKKDVLNGVLKGTKRKKGDPYKKTFVNGARRRNLLGESSSVSESESVQSHTEDSKPETSAPPVARKPLSQLFEDSDTSNEVSVNTVKKDASSKRTVANKGRGLKQMEKSLEKLSSSDSELDIPTTTRVVGNRGLRKKDNVPIYSDTESETSVTNTKNNSTVVATKGALKEFTGKRNTNKEKVQPVPPTKGRPRGKGKATGKRKKGDFDPTELIVPQREAAKKATESIRSVKGRGKDQAIDAPESPCPNTPVVSGVKEGASLPVAKIMKTKEIKGEVPQQESEKERGKNKKADKNKSPEQKPTTSKKIVKANNSNANAKTDEQLKDEYDFDVDGDPTAKSVSYVPQRQAAKKAAEHIRSGLSNIVAARLIIEDEMEASRKKAKLEKVKKSLPDATTVSAGKTSRVKGKSPARDASDVPSTIDEVAASPKAKATTKDRSTLKGADIIRAATKSAKKEPAKAVAKGVTKDTDWPFLDKGSQSACRRSRERSSSSSSSSSGSSSSGSSSSTRSSSSSRSSSPESASPEPNVTNKSPSLAKPTQSSSVCSTSQSPGRKLKTSERVPNSRLRSPTPPRAKPAAKGRGSKKPGPGRGPAPSPRASSSEPSPTRRSGRGDASAVEANVAKQRKPTGPRSGRNDSASPSRRPSPTKAKPQEKGQRRKREPKVSETNEDRAAGTSKTRTSPKAISKAPVELSSESEVESSRIPRSKAKSLTPSSSQTDIRNKPMPKTKKKELGLLSDSENSGADEKENSCLTSSVTSPKDAPKKAQKSSVPATSVMSPLTPSSENKEKDVNVSKSSDTEPETKRPRLDSTALSCSAVVTSTTTSQTNFAVTSAATVVPVTTATISSVFPCTSSAATTNASNTTLTTAAKVPLLSLTPSTNPTSCNNSVKSIFSPTAPSTRSESEILDFDNDLYDLARSVTEDSQRDGDDGQASGALSFAFSQDFLCREDNKEDSALATLNLVEKLRLQHAKKSGTNHRPSTESTSEPGESGSITEDAPKSPALQEIEIENKSSVIVSNHASAANEANSSSYEPPAKSPKVIGSESLDKSKSIQGDERWVPPSKETPSNASIQKSPCTVSHQVKIPPGSLSHSKATNIVISHATTDVDHGDRKVEAISKHSHAPAVYCPEVSQKAEPSPALVKPQVVNDIKEESPVPAPDNSNGGCNPSESIYVTTVHGRQFSQPLSISTSTSLPTTSSTIISSSISPGMTLSQLPFVGQNSGHAPASAGGPPFPHSPFLYNPALVSLKSQFYHQPPQTAIPKTSPTIIAQAPASGFPSSFPPHFLPTAQQIQQQQERIAQMGCSPPSTSSSSLPHRRISDANASLVDTSKVGLGIPTSLVNAVTSAMPPLSKPPLTSPSILLAASNVKTMTPPPPPQSTVAQIIESVVNNHSAAAAGTTSKLSALSNLNTSTNSNSLMNHLGAPTSSSKTLIASSLLNASGLLPNHLVPNKSSANLQSVSTVAPASKPMLNNDTTDFSAAILSNKTENIIPSGKAPGPRDVHTTVVPVMNAVSPKGAGRGKRPPAQRVKVIEKTVVVEEISPKSKGRGERKTSSSSPARGTHKAPATPRRSQGRGRGKGKSIVGVRKDLAGTVYDIDFDEFEENSEEKFDLRMLRERRKSSDVYASEAKKSEPPHASPPHYEKISPRYRNNFESDGARVETNAKTLPVLHVPLPGPVDMRTYSSSGTENTTNDGVVSFPHTKDPSAADIASLFMKNSSTVTASVTDLEELDKTLEALASSSNLPKSGLPPSVYQQHLNHISVDHKNNTQPIIPTGVESCLSNSKDVTQSVTTSVSEGDSRNQLKVKIKGPFLDANYSSHSITPSSGGTSFQNPLLHHNEPSHSMVMNVPPMMNNTSNLRRMRKKELLRQYWTQDMNMDGSSLNPAYAPEMSIHANSVPHPINRSVITIPKAVASMAIIPTKDDYRMENSPDDSLTLQVNNVPVPPPPPEKKRRNRVNREIAALGILPPDATPRERRRERPAPGSMQVSSPLTNEANSRKRGRTNGNKPNRSTFIPPTLVDLEDEIENSTSNSFYNSTTNNDPGKNTTLTSTGSSLVNKSSTGAINTASHPTPKLKIKFGSELTSVGPINNLASKSSGNLSDSDKDTPNKKAKGRPPKKRGIAEIPAPAPPTMEELKRQSMKFREMVMQDFAVAEKREILQLTGTRRHKKHKNKKGGSETDDSNRSKSPDVKVVTEIAGGAGAKLILRIKSRSSATGSTQSNSSNSSNQGGAEGKESNCASVPNNLPGNSALTSGKEDSNSRAGGEGSDNGNVKENGPVLASSVNVNDISRTTSGPLADMETGENDSGFPGSSEGSSGSVCNSSDIIAAKSEISKSAPPVNMSLATDNNNTSSISHNPKNLIGTGSNPGASSVNNSDDNHSSVDINNSESKAFEKIMPIRLKLSRCFEGYDGWKKTDQERDKGNPKQSDSCEVR